MNLRGRVAVLLGGNSAERAVSLQSGGAVLASLQRAGLDPVAIDPADGNLYQALAEHNIAHTFIALHGTGGEDGTMQGALELLGVTYTGSGVLASALGMDKLRTKWLWQGVGLPTAPFAVLSKESDWQQVMQRLGGTVMVKPSREGSSIGMARVTSSEALEAAYVEAAKYDESVLAEQWIEGEEYTVAIVGDQVLPPIKLVPNAEFYDFEAKYQANDTQYLCPCGLDTAREEELKQLAKQAFDSVGCHGWGRVDLMLDKQSGQFYLLEVNTSPGMTSHSLVPMAAQAAGMDFDALVQRIMALSVE